MRDFLKDVNLILNERLRNPLFGAFLFSWCIWNWKILLLLLSSLESDKKILLISNLISETGKYYCQLWLYPFLSALIYVLFYQIISIVPFFFWEKQKNFLKKIKQKIEDESPITSAEAEQLRKLNFEKLREIQSENDELQQRNLVLTSQLNEAKNKIDELNRRPIQISVDTGVTPSENKPVNYLKNMPQEVYKNLKSFLGSDSDKVINCFMALVKYGGRASASDIHKSSRISRIEIETSFETLREKSVLMYDSGFYYLSKKAKELVVDLDLT